MAGSVTAVAILAGGSSRRMGEDKALLRLDPNGPTTIERVVAVARAISDDMSIVCPEDRDYSRFGVRTIVDRFPGEGALGGIVSALEATDRPYSMVLSCDHPFLSVPLLRWMSELPPVQAAVPEIVLDGRKIRHPIHARYQRDALPILSAAFASGERRLQVAISLLETRIVDERDLQRFDPGMRSLWSVNTPDDATIARQLLADEKRRGR